MPFSAYMLKCTRWLDWRGYNPHGALSQNSCTYDDRFFGFSLPKIMFTKPLSVTLDDVRNCIVFVPRHNNVCVASIG